MNIRVDLNTPISDGMDLVFRSPVDCSQITGLVVYYKEGNNTCSKVFAFSDAHGNNVGDIDHLFAENVVVKVILDVTSGMAFVQNADTNAYIEKTFIKTINGKTPDENGNVEIETGNGSSQNANGLTTEAANLLITILQNAVYTSNQTGNISALADALASHFHTYTVEVTKEATCTTAGSKTYTCSCGDTHTEVIPATGHNYVGGTCTVCGAVDPSYSEDVTLTGISATYSGGEVVAGTDLYDLTGISVTAEYSDGSTEPVNGYVLSGEIAEGENTITVTYNGMTTTFTVTGYATAVPDEITVEDGVMTIITVGSEITVSDGVMTIT